MSFQILERAALAATLVGAVLVLGGCGALSRASAVGDDQAKARISHTGDAQLDKLNQGYSLLYQSASGLRLVDKILLVKFESDRTHRVVTAISDYCGQLTDQLKQLPQRYPSVRIDLKPLPEIERRKQAAANKARVLSFAPVVGRTGADFERTLLLTLSGGLNQLRFLTQVMADQERNPERAALLKGAHRHFLDLYKQTLKELSQDYYKVDDFNAADFKEP